jgi:hypothetical protein
MVNASCSPLHSSRKISNLRRWQDGPECKTMHIFFFCGLGLCVRDRCKCGLNLFIHGQDFSDSFGSVAVP